MGNFTIAREINITINLLLYRICTYSSSERTNIALKKKNQIITAIQSIRDNTHSDMLKKWRNVHNRDNLLQIKLPTRNLLSK